MANDWPLVVVRATSHVSNLVMTMPMRILEMYVIDLSVQWLTKLASWIISLIQNSCI